MSTPRRILIIRPSALGDVARSVPVLANLRRAFPDAAIDWLVQDAFVDVIRHHPGLTTAIPFPRKEFGTWVKGLKLGKIRAYLRTLRDRDYDLAIDAQGLARSALFAWATKAPTRIGYSNSREIGPLRRLAYTRLIPSDIEAHTVDRMVDLVEPFLSPIGQRADRSPAAMRLYASTTDQQWARALPIDDPAPIVLSPTSRWPGKQWPDDRFAALARHLAGRGRAVLIIASENERSQIPACLALSSKPGQSSASSIIDLVGATTIGQLMALIERSALVVANDSAALHIAVGFDRPTVALFGPSRTNRNGPYRRTAIEHAHPGEEMDYKNDTLGRAMMERITLDEVIQACERELSVTSPAHQAAASHSSSQTPA